MHDNRYKPEKNSDGININISIVNLSTNSLNSTVKKKNKVFRMNQNKESIYFIISTV